MPKKSYVELKFREPLDGKSIRRLTTELGYTFHSRNIGRWIIYRKWLTAKPVDSQQSNVIQLPDLTKRTPKEQPPKADVETPWEDGPAGEGIVTDPHEINDATALILNRECISICETYWGLQDVTRDEVSKAIRAYSYSKGNPAHRAWIQEWVINNIDNVSNDQLPW